MEVLRKLGRYDLVRVLGKGAMGVVYEGHDPSLGRRVAVKTILRHAALDPDTERSYAQRFAQEARAVARLNHPNIVQVYDFGVEDDVAYLVMEFIDGRELRSLFESGERVPLPEAARLMGELLDALDFAHEAGVIHRDVKPANVMLDGQRRLKLADFGVARVQDGTQRTQADTMVGSPAYMSPEQISGARIDRRTDIFAAGVVLYQFLTGDKPFKGDTPWAVLAAIAQEQPPPPTALVPGLPPVFDTLVASALAKDPAARYPTARAFATALRAAQAGDPTELPTLFPAAATRPQPAPAPAASRAPDPSATSDAELEFWRSVQSTADPAELETYIAQFPQGTYSALARVKLARMKAGAASPGDLTMPPAASLPPQRPTPREHVAPQAGWRGKAAAPARLAGAALAAALVAGGAIWWTRAPAPGPVPPAPAQAKAPPNPAESPSRPSTTAPAVAPPAPAAAEEQARVAQAAASQAAADRAAAEKAAAKVAAEREQMAREARRIAEDKLAAEKAAAAAAAERAAAERLAAERAAADRAAAKATPRPGNRPVAEALAARAAERRSGAASATPSTPAPATAAPETRFFANEDMDWGVAPTSEPRIKPLHAPTPRTIPGGRVITTLDLKKMLEADKSVVVIDVLDIKARTTVPGAVWMPGAGKGRLAPAHTAAFANALQRLTAGSKAKALVFLCLNAECWLSYNAALHALEAGYTQVYWYRGGTDAWVGAGLPRRPPQPVDW